MTQKSEDPLQNLHRILTETTAPQKSKLGFSYLPRFINPPAIEMTKSLISGVDCDEVYPNIFVGDEGSARNREFLMAVGITHVLNTAEGNGFGQVSTGPSTYAGTGIEYLGLRLMDLPSTRIIVYFTEGVDFIHKALESNGKVLVHCLMGMSRSATFVAAYLMMKKGMSVQEALRVIRAQRECRPNDGFLIQLLQQEKLLGATKA